MPKCKVWHRKTGTGFIRPKRISVRARMRAAQAFRARLADAMKQTDVGAQLAGVTKDLDTVKEIL